MENKIEEIEEKVANNEREWVEFQNKNQNFNLFNNWKSYIITYQHA